MRTYTKFTSSKTQHFLDVLVDQRTPPLAYQDAMRALGKELAENIAQSYVKDSSSVCIACTVEDADFLARGLLEGLMDSGMKPDQVKLACFWNQRVNSFEGDEDRSFDVAPVVKEYREAVDLSHSVVIVLKSIISGACVVKTNLATLIHDAVPTKVIVAAPVMLEGAEEKLAREFPAAISDLFEYMTFAVDDEKRGDDVIPGIGGQVYDRLGFVDKNTYVPSLVKERRMRAVA